MTAPIKTCDYCCAVGVMPTFMNGETVCYDCLPSLPKTMREAWREIVSLRAKIAEMENQEPDAEWLDAAITLIERAESDLATAEQDSRQKQARIERLTEALSNLLNDLEERAKWNLEEDQRVVACGNSVYVRAKAALEESK